MNNKFVTIINNQIEDFLKVLDFINPKFKFVFLGSIYIVVIFSIITRLSKNILKPNILETYSFNFSLYMYIQDILLTLFEVWFFYVAYLGCKIGIKKEG